MKRDGACTSLWQQTTPGFQNQSSQNNNSYDVIIAGGGITGITTGLLLQQSGKKVLIAEAKNIGFGTTGGTTAHLNTFMDTPYHTMQKNFGDTDTQLAAKAIHQSLALIQENVKELSIDCGYKELAAYLFSQDDDQSKELEKIYTASIDCGVETKWITTIPVPLSFDKALYFPGQATFHPTRYLQAIAAAFVQGGGTLLEDCRITKVEEGPPHKVISSKGKFSCQHFIYATHIPPGVNLLHFRCAPYRSYAMAVQLENEHQYPDALVYDMYDPYHYYRTQEIDGALYFIAGGEDHKTGHEENTEGCFRKLEAHIRKHFAVKKIVSQWSSQYYEPTDGLPYIGHLPGHKENMYVATGYGGNGMVYSGVAAITLSDMIVKGESEFEELFDPNRIKLVAGFQNFVKESADVVGKIFGKLVPADKLEGMSEMAKGEAKIVKYEGQRLALYKDENGEVFAVNSACTHIKCDVSWNSAEKTWDCPCHGSRFSYTGEMLTAPARKDLEKIEVMSEEKLAH